MEELKSSEITRDQYFEWKINWPQTCDGCGKFEPKSNGEYINIKCFPTAGNLSNDGEFISLSV